MLLKQNNYLDTKKNHNVQFISLGCQYCTVMEAMTAPALIG